MTQLNESFSNLCLGSPKTAENSVPTVKTSHIGWSSHEFIPKTVNPKHENEVFKNKTSQVDEFFTSLPSQINELNLIEKDTNAVYNICIELVENVNKLNEELIGEPSDFTPQQV